jgi:hypothetical protein
MHLHCPWVWKGFESITNLHGLITQDLSYHSIKASYEGLKTIGINLVSYHSCVDGLLCC